MEDRVTEMVVQMGKKVQLLQDHPLMKVVALGLSFLHTDDILTMLLRGQMLKLEQLEPLMP